MDNEHVICKPTLPALLTCFTSQGFFPPPSYFDVNCLDLLLFHLLIYLLFSWKFLTNFFLISLPQKIQCIYIYIYIYRKNKLKKKPNKIYWFQTYHLFSMIYLIVIFRIIFLFFNEKLIISNLAYKFDKFFIHNNFLIK